MTTRTVCALRTSAGKTILSFSLPLAERTSRNASRNRVDLRDIASLLAYGRRVQYNRKKIYERPDADYPTYQALASRSVSAVWRRYQSLNCFTLEFLGIRAFTSSNPGTAAQRSLLPAFRSSWFHSGLSSTQKPSRSLPLPSCCTRTPF